MSTELTVDSSGNIVTAGTLTQNTTPAANEALNVASTGEVLVQGPGNLGSASAAFQVVTADGWQLLGAADSGLVQTLKNTLDDGSGDASFSGDVAGVFLDKGGSHFNVKAYGATGVGDDDTTAIQTAINACAAAGGGVVFFPPGTYGISSAVTLPSFVILQGSGAGAGSAESAGQGTGGTILLARTNGTSGAKFAPTTAEYSVMVMTQYFASYFLSGYPTDYASYPNYTWTDESTSPPTTYSATNKVGVFDLAIDGNFQMTDANDNPITCLAIGGYDWNLSRIECRWASGNNVTTYFGPIAYPLPPDSMESRVVDSKFHHAAGHGFQFIGPHDSLFSNCHFYLNNFLVGSSSEPYAGTAGSTSTLFSGLTLQTSAQVANCHSYGQTQCYAFLLTDSSDENAGPVNFSNCTAETAQLGATYVAGGMGCFWVGGQILGAATGFGVTPQLTGFILDNPGDPGTLLVLTTWSDIETWADFVNDAGASYLRGLAVWSGGTPGYAGSPASTSSLDVWSQQV